jgi:hypothetical protein
MCPGDQAGFTGGYYIDGPGTVPDGYADNLFSLSGIAGAKLKLEKNTNTGGWIVTQVGHRAFSLAVDNQFMKYEDCALHGKVLEDSSVMSCRDASEWKKQLDMYEHDIVTDVEVLVPDSGCTTLRQKVEKACLFTPPAPETIDVLAFSVIDVLVDHRDSGDCAQLLPQQICVASVGATGAWEDFICGDDCA